MAERFRQRKTNTPIHVFLSTWQGHLRPGQRAPAEPPIVAGSPRRSSRLGKDTQKFPRKDFGRGVKKVVRPGLAAK